MLSRAGNYFCSNFKLTTNLVSNQYHRANPAPKSTVFATKNQVCEIIPTRSRKPPLKQFCIGDLAGVIVVIRNIHKIWTLQTSVVILLSRQRVYYKLFSSHFQVLLSILITTVK